MIKFKDFIPEASTNLLRTKTKDFESAVADMNAWLDQNRSVKIITIETLLFADIHNLDEQNQTTKGKFRDEGTMYSYQFVRLWYQD